MGTQKVGLILIVFIIIICATNAKDFRCTYTYPPSNLDPTKNASRVTTCEFKNVRFGKQDIFNIILPSEPPNCGIKTNSTKNETVNVTTNEPCVPNEISTGNDTLNTLDTLNCTTVENLNTTETDVLNTSCDPQNCIVGINLNQTEGEVDQTNKTCDCILDVNLNATEIKSNKTKVCNETEQVVRQVKFKDSFVYKLPNSVFSTFDRLEIFDGAYMRLKEITTLSFNKAIYLEYILLQGNRLTTLKNHIFVHCKSLKVLDLSNNSIEALPQYVFKSLNKLAKLDLSMNKIKKIDLDTFESLEKVEYIWLKSNQIEEISPNIFTENNKELRFIDLSNNMLTAISMFSFEKPPNLKFLMLKGNKCVSDDFINKVISDNVYVKSSMSDCYKAYKKLYPKQENEEQQKNTENLKNLIATLEEQRKGCIEEQNKYAKELNEILEVIKEFN